MVHPACFDELLFLQRCVYLHLSTYCLSLYTLTAPSVYERSDRCAVDAGGCGEKMQILKSRIAGGMMFC